MNLFFKKLLFPLALVLCFTACEKDDSPTENTPADTSGPIIDDEGNINIAALQKANPNFKLENLRRNGASAKELVSDFQYKSITLEIVSVKGFEPSAFAKQTLLDFIEARLNKSNGVKIIEKSIDPPGIESYDVQNVFSEIEVKNRTQFNDGTDLAVFIFFADKDDKKSEFSRNMSSIILGTAYLNTSFVIYEKTLRTITRNNISNLQKVEAGTLNHEFCHLLGLVNSEFTPEQSAHESNTENEDGETVGDRHCNIPFCLMEASANLIPDMMGNLKVLELDPLCIKDLQAIGGK